MQIGKLTRKMGTFFVPGEKKAKEKINLTRCFSAQKRVQQKDCCL